MTQIYDPDNYDIRTAVPYLMSRVRMALLEALDEKLRPFDIKATEWVIILMLANKMAGKASEICSVMSSDPGAMTRKIDHLERKGFVRRVRDAEDRRSIRLELTTEGNLAYPRILATAVGVLNDFLRGFTKQEVRQMEKFLGRMLANAAQTSSRSA